MTAAEELLDAIEATTFYDCAPRSDSGDWYGSDRDDLPVDGSSYTPLTVGHVRRLRDALARHEPPPVTPWGKVVIALCAGLLFGYITSEIKGNVSERLRGLVHDRTGCATITGDVCR